MKFNKLLYLVTAFAIGVTGCKKEDFVEANTNPTTIYEIKPEEQFLNAGIRAHNSDFEAYYDTYRRIMPWMQMNTGLSGNSKTFLNDVGNFNQRYNVFFPELGAILTDVQKIIEAMPEEERAQYVHMHAIPDILKIYYAFYVSDINGSIPYTEAFQARYGGTTNPAYQTQQELFDLWDARLKEVIGILKSTPTAPQVSLGVNDLYFQGDVNKWAKAANALRMRMAFRLLKRDASKATAIINDALSDPSLQMTSNEDSWVMYADVSFSSGGNFNPGEFRAPKPTVDFMWDNDDPRLRLFYQQNNYSQANINTAIAAGVLPAGTTEKPRRFIGAHISPDSTQGIYRTWFQTKTVNPNLTLDTVSYLQRRMWQPIYNNGTGQSFFPIITYADYSFMRAEAYARNIATGSAEDAYYEGIEASIEFFDDAAARAKIEDYVPVTQQEIDDYKNAPEVKWDPAKAIELIMVQAYINFYKQPNEAWANFKRTGYPNKSSVLANEDIVIDGVVKAIPRRAAINEPLPTDQNYSTRKPAIDAMAQDPGFGQGPSDVFGRVWWDVQ
jgi:hypothetical protein